jgi:hypothetical protein
MKYIEFNLVEQKPKTSVYAIRNVKSQTIIGWLKWHPSWRQYCFFPEQNTVFSYGCLNDIIEQVNLLKKTREANKK